VRLSPTRPVKRLAAISCCSDAGSGCRAASGVAKCLGAGSSRASLALGGSAVAAVIAITAEPRIAPMSASPVRLRRALLSPVSGREEIVDCTAACPPKGVGSVPTPLSRE